MTADSRLLKGGKHRKRRWNKNRNGAGVGEPTPPLGLSLVADGERNNSFGFLESQEKTPPCKREGSLTAQESSEGRSGEGAVRGWGEEAGVCGFFGSGPKEG